MKNEKGTFSVLFYLKKDKMKKNGLVPIHARITINGKQTQFNTKLEVLETNWKSGRAIGKSMEIQRLNSMLDDIKANIRSHFHNQLMRDSYVARHEKKPQMLQFKTAEEETFAIATLISIYRTSAHKSLDIICKTEKQAHKLADKLKSHGNDIYFLSSQNSAFVQGIVITSAHMAKGLEFDEVIIPQVEEGNYYSEIDWSMLYVAATRAMHRLTLTYSGTKHTPFI